MDIHIGQNQCVSCELCWDGEEPEFQQYHPSVFQMKHPIAIIKNKIKQ